MKKFFYATSIKENAPLFSLQSKASKSFKFSFVTKARVKLKGQDSLFFIFSFFNQATRNRSYRKPDMKVFMGKNNVGFVGERASAFE